MTKEQFSHLQKGDRLRGNGQMWTCTGTEFQGAIAWLRSDIGAHDMICAYDAEKYEVVRDG